MKLIALSLIFFSLFRENHIYAEINQICTSKKIHQRVLGLRGRPEPKRFNSPKSCPKGKLIQADTTDICST